MLAGTRPQCCMYYLGDKVGLVKCKDCKYWKRETKECKRYPPRRTIYVTGVGSDRTVFPITDHKEECGEGIAET